MRYCLIIVLISIGGLNEYAWSISATTENLGAISIIGNLYGNYVSVASVQPVDPNVTIGPPEDANEFQVCSDQYPEVSSFPQPF